jgi:hypothetical protein
MEGKKFLTGFKLAFIAVGIHTFLLIVVLVMWLLPSRNTTEFGFMLLMIIFIFDLPVQWIFWPVWVYVAGNGTEAWPDLGGNILLGKVITCLLFIVIGGVYWFCIGMIIETIRKIKRKVFG